MHKIYSQFILVKWSILFLLWSSTRLFSYYHTFHHTFLQNTKGKRVEHETKIQSSSVQDLYTTGWTPPPHFEHVVALTVIEIKLYDAITVWTALANLCVSGDCSYRWQNIRHDFKWALAGSHFAFIAVQMRTVHKLILCRSRTACK